MCYMPIYKCIQCLQISFLSLHNKWSQPQQHKTRHINYLIVSMDQDWHNLIGSSLQDLKSLHSALLRTEFSSEAQLEIDPLPGTLRLWAEFIYLQLQDSWQPASSKTVMERESLARQLLHFYVTEYIPLLLLHSTCQKQVTGSVHNKEETTQRHEHQEAGVAGPYQSLSTTVCLKEQLQNNMKQ